MDERMILRFCQTTVGAGKWIQPDENDKFLHTDCGGYIYQVLMRVGRPLPNVERFNQDQGFWRSMGKFSIIRRIISTDAAFEANSKGLHLTTLSGKIANVYEDVPVGLNLMILHTMGQNVSWGSFTHVGIYDVITKTVYNLADDTRGVVRADDLWSFVNLDPDAEIYFCRIPAVAIMAGKNLRDDSPEHLDSYAVLSL
jgi:hypothetical protein